MEKRWYEIIKFEFDDEFNQLPVYMQKCIKANTDTQDWLIKKESDSNLIDIEKVEDLNFSRENKVNRFCFYAGKLTHRCPECDGYGFVNNIRCPRCIGWGIEYLEKDWKHMIQIQTENAKIFRIKNITQKDVRKIQAKIKAESKISSEKYL
ncbi:MAG: hypothetical protein ACTTHU_08280 [Treponema sp.]